VQIGTNISATAINNIKSSQSSIVDEFAKKNAKKLRDWFDKNF
jgi:Zn-dependent M32 family carboxypeptidase